MFNSQYINYLNSLHNYSAQNPNAYGEKNVNNMFFSKVAVKVGLCDYIENQLINEKPHILVLTGHAGDGKTSIMYQVLSKLGIQFEVDKKITSITLPNNSECKCIKDFSELNNDEKLRVLKECVKLSKNGTYIFMVSNTGPLINTFGELFSVEEREDAKIQLIEAMDENSGEIRSIYGCQINVVNVAKVDNTKFAVSFVRNLIKESLWEKCKQCQKCSYCYIYGNRNIIEENKQRVFEFLEQYYIWLVEHGTRLTIRSMTEQLAFMITGGKSCEEVISVDPIKPLFFNLFFGYYGLKNNDRADCILAVKTAKKCFFDRKRLRAEEKLLIDYDNYDYCFGASVSKLISNARNSDERTAGWIEFLRRAYMFTNIVTDENLKTRDIEDLFSKQFERFIKLRNSETNSTSTDRSLVFDALSMMYIGKLPERNERSISITLSTKSGLTQNVQLSVGSLEKNKLNLITELTKDSKFDPNNKRKVIKLQINGKILDYIITLPLLDYFEELRDGVIVTNIDPQLSHGVESIKTQIADECKVVENEDIEIIVSQNVWSQTFSFEINNNRINLL